MTAQLAKDLATTSKTIENSFDALFYLRSIHGRDITYNEADEAYKFATA